MIVSYSSLNRLETPGITLCNPGSVYNDGLLTNVVSILVDVTDMEIVFNFNSTSELNFRVNLTKRENKEENAHIYSTFKSLQNRRLLFVENIGYFMIKNINDGFDGHSYYKDISAQSIEVEIQQKMIPFIADGTYRFATDEVSNTKGLIDVITEAIPLWTVEHIDDTVASKFRTFEDVDTSSNCLGFMLENMQDAYECIFIFDPIKRTIKVYDQSNYVKQTDIHITKDDVINSINITEDAEDIYTAINVLGDDDVTIGAVNPTGTNTIYDFSYYLDWMTPELGEKVLMWQNKIEEFNDKYYELSLNYYNSLAKSSNYQLELQKIETQITMYTRCRNNIVAESDTGIIEDYNKVIIDNGGTPIEVMEEIGETISYIDNLIAECQSRYDNTKILLSESDSEADSYRNEMLNIQDELSMEDYFTKSELEELSNYIFEGSYNDEYVVITETMTYEEKFQQMKTLYDRAKLRLERVSQPAQEFDIDTQNFIFENNFKHWSEQLETGCLINVEIKDNDIASLFLSNITVNYEDHSLSLTFGNRFNKFDIKSLFDDMLGDISKSSNTLDYVKEILFPIKNGDFDNMKEALQTSRNLTMGSALASENEEVVIDGSGYTGRKMLEEGVYDPHQIKINGKTIIFTDDAWETCKVAIGELILGEDNSAYGINAETIIGDLIIGKGLRILDENGKDIFTVVDSKITSSIYGDANGVLEDGSDSISKRLTSVEQTSDSYNIRINTLENKSGEVDHVVTSTGYSFNADGLTIHKSGEEITNKMDNTGMYVSRSEEEVLTANNEGVNAINLTARQYLIIGKNSRLEDYSNGTDSNRTACFYLGE